MSSPPVTTPRAQIVPSPEVEPINQLISDTFLKDPKFLLTALVGGLAIFLYLLYGTSSKRSSSALKRGKGGEPVVVLTGPSDSGKTTIFSKLIYGHPAETHTSLKPSTSTLILPASSSSNSAVSSPEKQAQQGRQIKISDIPGHPRLKASTKSLLREASAGVFVVDVGGLVRNGSAVAEQLPPILIQLAAASLSNPTQPIPRLLILAHKTDLLSRSSSTTNTAPTAEETLKLKTTAVERTKLILTREMDKLKSSRGTTSGRIESIERVSSGSSSSNSEILAKIFPFLFSSSAVTVSGGMRQDEDEDSSSSMEEAEMMVWGREGRFEWDHVEGVEVVWGSSFVRPTAGAPVVDQGLDGLEDVREWLGDL